MKEFDSNNRTKSFCNYIHKHGIPISALAGTIENMVKEWISNCRENKNFLYNSDIKIIRNARLYDKIFRQHEKTLRLLNKIESQINKLKAQAENLQSSIGVSIPTKRNQKVAVSNNKKWAKTPRNKFVSHVSESDIIGHLDILDKNGNEVTLGIENYCVYSKGSVKLFCRKKNSQGRYTCLSYIWLSSPRVVSVKFKTGYDISTNKAV